MANKVPGLGFRQRGGPVLLLAAAVGLAFFQNLGNAPLFDRDEGAFSEATREMVVTIQGLVILFCGALAYMMKGPVERSYLRLFGGLQRPAEQEG